MLHFLFAGLNDADKGSRRFCVMFSPFQLDAGSEEKIMLVSRDEQSCLVVSFKDVKTNMESAFKYVLFGLVH